MEEVFPLIDYPLQYMEMPLPSYSSRFISSSNFFLSFCPFQKQKLASFPQEVDQQNNYMVTVSCPLIQEVKSQGGGGAVGRSWTRIMGNVGAQKQV